MKHAVLYIMALSRYTKQKTYLRNLFMEAINHRQAMFELTLDRNMLEEEDYGFRQWASLHYYITCEKTYWLATRGHFMTTDDVKALCKGGYKAMGEIPILNDMAGNPGSRREQLHFNSDAIDMGNNMEDVVRDYCIPSLFPQFSVQRAGRMVSFQAPGCSSTGDIALFDSVNRLCGMIEVKTISSCQKPRTERIPTDKATAKAKIRDLLHEKEKFLSFEDRDIRLRRGQTKNLFRQSSPLIDKRTFDTFHSIDGFKETAVGGVKCMAHHLDRRHLIANCRENFNIHHKAIVAFYNYDNSEIPACVYRYDKDDSLDLCLNPFSTIGVQVLNQTVQYGNSDLFRSWNKLLLDENQLDCNNITEHDKTKTENTQNQCENNTMLSTNPHFEYLYLMFVIPYESKSQSPKPYAIVLIPFHFSRQIQEALIKCLINEISRYIDNKKQ